MMTSVPAIIARPPPRGADWHAGDDKRPEIEDNDPALIFQAFTHHIEEVIMKRKEFLEMSGLVLAGTLAPGRTARAALAKAGLAGAAGGCRIEAKI